MIWVKVLLFYVFFSFVVDSTLLNLDNSKDKVLIYAILSIFTIIEYSIFSYFLYSVIDNKIFRTIILVSTVGFFLFAIYYFFNSKYNSFDSLSASIGSILIVAYCIFYLFDQLNKPQVMFIYQDPSFWFVVGLMVYLSGTLFLFIQANELDAQVRKDFWKINLFANITKNILFAIAFSTKKSNSIIQSFENPYDDILENPYKTL